MILCSESITEGDAQMTYSPNTYIVVGNDGNHFNNAVNSGTNYSVGSSTLSALYTLSDHLPVIADFDLEGQHLGVASTEKNWTLPNPMPTGYILDNPEGHELQLYTLGGQLLWKSKDLQATLPYVAPGVYLLRKTTLQGPQTARISIR